MVTFPNHSKSTKAKHSLRMVGIDDGTFRPNRRLLQKAPIVAILFRNLQIMNSEVGLVQVDGTDANRVLMKLLKRMRYDVIMLSGISFAGFNVVDIGNLAASTQRPVIAITGEKPDNQAVRVALRDHFTDWENRWRMIRAAGRVHGFKPHREDPTLYFEVRGGSTALAKRCIAATAKISRLPEPIRVARIVARGLSDLVKLTVP